jgi:hypothetical protein
VNDPPDDAGSRKGANDAARAERDALRVERYMARRAARREEVRQQLVEDWERRRRDLFFNTPPPSDESEGE